METKTRVGNWKKISIASQPSFHFQCKVKHADQIYCLKHNKNDQPTIWESKEQQVSEGKNADHKTKTEYNTKQKIRRAKIEDPGEQHCTNQSSWRKSRKTQTITEKYKAKQKRANVRGVEGKSTAKTWWMSW